MNLIVKMLLDNIKRNDAKTTVADFSNNFLSDEDFSDLFQSLKTNTYLTHLNLCESGIKEEHIQGLSEAIHDNSTLVELDIQVYQDYTDEIKELIDGIRLHVNHNKNPLRLNQ